MSLVGLAQVLELPFDLRIFDSFKVVDNPKTVVDQVFQPCDDDNNIGLLVNYKLESFLCLAIG